MSDLQNPVAVAAPLSPPVLLREAREAAGLHIAALAAFLKVPVKKLEALEAGRYDELPDMTFARALASSACRHLKVDPAPVLEQIPTAHSPQLGDSPQSINTPFKGPSAAAAFNPAGWLSRPAVLAAIALLLGSLVLVFLPMPSGEPAADAVLPPAGAPGETVAPEASGGEEAPREAPTLAAPAAATSDLPVVSAEPPAASAEQRSTPQTPPAPVPTASPAPKATATTALAGTATSAGPASGSLLSIVAAGETWVEVVNGKGGQVVQRVLKAGDVMNFSSTPPYAVVIGRADVAQVTVRGQPFDITPFARNSVARFEVK